MKKIAPLILLCAFTFCSGTEQKADNFFIGVVKSVFDPIEKVLLTYNIPHDVLDITDLEKNEILARYGAIFFPCGMEMPIHERIGIMADGNNISAVSLNKKFHETDDALIGKNIRRFVKNGGAAYFSGFAFKQLQSAFEPFDFFSNNPYIGEEGRVPANLSGDLSIFCNAKESVLYMTHSGWISIKSAKDGKVIAEGKYSTPLGEKEGPISVLFKRGRGEILYTSYHNTVYSDFRRFNIYRIAAHNMIESAAEAADRNGQKILARIGDAIHDDENVRTYRLPLKSGANTLYMLFDAAGFQIDLLSGSRKIIESRDSFEKEFSFNIYADEDSYCLVRIFPRKGIRFTKFAIISAAGMKTWPYYIKILLLAALAAAAIIAFFILLPRIRNLFRYTPKPRRIF